MRMLEKIPSSMMGVTMIMATLSPVVMIASVRNPELMGIWIVIYIAVGVVSSLGAYLFQRSQKNKAEGFSKGVEQNAGSAEGVKDPNKIAQIDHMRKEFQKGIDIYKKYGKDLYSLPWYVVVGEAGSGKTEAVRRSEIGFPDKLQDKWQGSGGTLSMHWWFTNKAVILDTAGRLFVQDGSDADGAQNQWVSFLQMLKRNRPDCPINGLILVIPATRLLAHEDPEAEAASLARIDQNAGQISRQLEVLQGELGIRFPVYILVSKTDKITGFREYFDGIDTADARYQMLGWSNPAPLGESFDPQSVADYLKSVADRLKRRMMTELRNPEPAAMSDLRIDEVDALFSFPASFASMAPKLQRYLRQVFSADEWSARPPFLRGIYFSSALQQGRVLDEAVARALGIPLEQMDTAEEGDGLRLSKNRTYFMRDLFLEKIFREKGLVTRSDKVKSSVAGWKLWLPASFVACLLVLGLLGLWPGKRGEEEKQAWTNLWDSEKGEDGRRIAPLIKTEQGKSTWGERDVFDALARLGAEVQNTPRMGWIFAPAQWFDRGLERQRREVFVDVVAGEFAELVAQVAARLEEVAASPDGLKPREWRALKALLIVHHAGFSKDGGKMVLLGGKPSTEVPVLAVLGDLTEFLDLKDKERQEQLASILETAAKTKDADFKRELGKALDPKTVQAVMKKAFPENSILQTDDFAKKINDFAEEFDHSIGMFGKPEPDPRASERAEILRKGADRLLKDYSVPIANSGSATFEQGAGEGDGRTGVSDLVKQHGSLQRDYPQVVRKQEEKLTSRSDELAKDDGAILKGIVAALSPDGGDGFSSREADDLLAALKKSAAEDDADAKNLNILRIWWLKHDFYPKRFYKHLRFPLVSDGETGSSDDLYVLLKLVEALEVSGLEKPELKNLSNAANAVFDLADLPEDPHAAVRMVSMKPLDPTAQTLTMKVLDAATGRLVMIYATRTTTVFPPTLVPLNQALEFKIESGGSMKFGTWDILRWRTSFAWNKAVQGEDMRGLTFEFSMPDDVKMPPQDRWPTLKDFGNPE